MNKEQLLILAKTNYPIGCVFKNQLGQEYTLEKDSYTYQLYDNTIYAHHGAGLLYWDGRWAELVSYPKNYKKTYELW